MSGTGGPAYDPLVAPFDLPVQRWRARCRFARPVRLVQRWGATAGTLLWGAFGEALWGSVCAGRDQGPPCNVRVGAAHCLHPGDCQVPWLYKPSSAVHRRQMSRPVLLYSPELEGGERVLEFTLETTLWGRHAVSAGAMVGEAVAGMGRAGLQVDGARFGFEVEGWEREASARLAQWVASARALDWRSGARLVFDTPFLHKEDVKDEGGFTTGHWHLEGDLPLTDIVGRAAYELAAWDIEDRGLGEALDSKARHSLCRDTRDAARRSVAGLRVERADLRPAAKGMRYSRHNGHYFPLLGFTGWALLGGDLAAALPWLWALALGGGGQKRSMGFGRVQLLPEAG